MAALVAVVVLLVVGALGFGKLRDIYLEQCVITDMAEQVSITSGKMVKADVIAENLGLRKGVNLAKIDFVEKRRAGLEKWLDTVAHHSFFRFEPCLHSFLQDEEWKP